MPTHHRALHVLTGRDEAEHAIQRAFLALETWSAEPGQLSDLADAIDAFGDHTWGVAAQLATAAMSAKRQPVASHSRHPLAESLTLSDMRAAFVRVRRAENAHGTEGLAPVLVGWTKNA